jgi:glycosyltransferase involved in cell wall biosynthesis
MRALFISRHLPDDPATSVFGVFKRMGMFIEAASRLVDELDMLFYVPPGFDVSPPEVARMQVLLREMWGPKVNLFMVRHARNPQYQSNWEQYGAGIFSIFRQEDFYSVSGPEQVRALDDCLARKPDWILAHRLHAMCPLMRTVQSLPPIFVDLDDIEHRAHFRRVIGYPRWAGERLKVLQTPALRAAELRAIRFARSAFVCSDTDRDYLQGRAKSGNVLTVPNSVPIPELADAFCEKPNLLFLGTFVYRPNIQAADFLVEKIWPLIRAQVPEARLIIAGGEAQRMKHFHSPPAGVDYVGFVPNLDALYRDVRVVCCPILTGAGTRIKIVEAAAHAKAIVSTTLGAEGLQLNNEQAILLRDDATSFAQACVQLLGDRARCESLGAVARCDAMLRYDRVAVVEQITTHIGVTLLRA